MSEPTGKDSPAALSPAAELVIGHARKTAAANGRTVPSGEDLLLCLLIVGLMEEPFIDALTSVNVSANDLRGEIIKLGHTRLEENKEQVAALQWHAAQFWEELGRRSAAGYDLDCCAFTAALLESDYLAESTRKLVLSRGLTPEVLLRATSAGWRTRPVIADFEGRDLEGLSECPCQAPPLGFALDEVDLPELIGRDKVLAQVAHDFAAGKQIRITGTQGTGKSLLARVAAATSGRPAIWVSDEEVSSLPASERAALFPALVAYLREIGGGLVLTGLDSSAFARSSSLELAAGKSAMATLLGIRMAEGAQILEDRVCPELILTDLPLIVTVRDRGSALPVRIAGPWTEVALRPLSKIKAAAALAAWNQESGRSPVDEDTLAVSVELATRFLGGEQALPGSAIALLKAATCAPVPKSLKSAPSDPPAVTLEGLEEAVCYLTGLPLAIVSEVERLRLASFGDILAQSLIGQRRAVDDVAAAIVRHELSISANTRPIGSFLFVGPTGVGKTELARVLAAERYGSADALVRFDMAEFFDRYEIARLIGSPPGYIGSNKDGQLIEAIKRRKGHGGVLLLDEIEKADNSLYDFFLGALDYGQISAANSGEKVSLREWIIIFTSNVGSGEGADARRRGVLGFGGEVNNPAARGAAARAKAIEGHFRNRPEFINRLDALVQFDDLSDHDLGQILDLHFAAYAAPYAEIGLGLRLDASLRNHLVNEAAISGMGARDLVTRQFHTQIENRMTGALLEGLYLRGAAFVFKLEPGASDSNLVRLAPDGSKSRRPRPTSPLPSDPTPVRRPTFAREAASAELVQESSEFSAALAALIERQEHRPRKPQ